jgi:hypothetical protein
LLDYTLLITDITLNRITDIDYITTAIDYASRHTPPLYQPLRQLRLPLRLSLRQADT